MAATKSYLVRHAHADWAADESRPLSESGLAAAETIAGLLYELEFEATALIRVLRVWAETA